MWKLGKIKELIVGRDGLTRGASVSVATKGRSCATLNRPLQLLYPLEINQPPDTKINSPGTLNPPGTTEQKDVSGGADQSDAPEKSRRPQRASAKKGEERSRTWIAQLGDDVEP